MDVVDLVAVLEAVRTRALVGITGPPACGKTHLARHLHAELVTAHGPDAARIVAMDGFHLTNAELERLGRRDRKGRPDTFDAAGLVELLRRLRTADGPVTAPGFDRALDEPVAGAVTVEASVPVVLVEGNYLLLDGPWAEVAGLLDLAVYVETQPDVRRARLLDRQVRSHGSPAAARRWIERVDDPNAAVVEGTRPRADHVVVTGELPGAPLW